MPETMTAPRVTSEQFTRIGLLLSLFDVPADVVLRRAQRISGRQMASIKELSPKEAARLIQELEPNWESHDFRLPCQERRLQGNDERLAST